MTLQPRTVDRLNDILIYLHDSEKGYNECAKVIHSEKIKPLLRAEAEERLHMIKTIEDHIFQSGGGEVPTQRGSITAPLHRIFVDIKALLTGGDTDKILDEIKRSENSLTKAYQEALHCVLPDELQKVLKKHMAHIRKKCAELGAINVTELGIGEANEESFPASDPPAFTKEKMKAEPKAESKAEVKTKAEPKIKAELKTKTEPKTVPKNVPKTKKK